MTPVIERFEPQLFVDYIVNHEVLRLVLEVIDEMAARMDALEGRIAAQDGRDDLRRHPDSQAA
jgi:hypothetical protein